jgi:hypothetical protein
LSNRQVSLLQASLTLDDRRLLWAFIKDSRGMLGHGPPDPYRRRLNVCPVGGPILSNEAIVGFAVKDSDPGVGD